MHIYIGADKAGFSLKQELVKHLEKFKYSYTDFGPETEDEMVSFVKMAGFVANEIAQNQKDRGILICGTGMGMSLAANKHRGIYAAVVESAYTARLCRLINNANVLCLGGFILGPKMAADIADIFLETEYLHEFEKWRVDFLNSQLDLLKNVERKNFN